MTTGTKRAYLWSPDPKIECTERVKNRMSMAEYDQKLDDTEMLEKGAEYLLAENKLLRRMLCIAYAGSQFYGDDGELQDNREFPMIDFKRDPATVIHNKIQDRAQKRLTEYLQSLHNAAKPEERK